MAGCISSFIVADTRFPPVDKYCCRKCRILSSQRIGASWAQELLWPAKAFSKLDGQRSSTGERVMHLSNESILVILFVGIIAGWLAGSVMEGAGFGLIGDLIV